MLCWKPHLPLLYTMVNTHSNSEEAVKAAEGAFYNGPLRLLKWESASWSEDVFVSVWMYYTCRTNSASWCKSALRQMERWWKQTDLKMDFKEVKEMESLCVLWLQIARQHKYTIAMKRDTVFFLLLCVRSDHKPIKPKCWPLNLQQC